MRKWTVPAVLLVLYLILILPDQGTRLDTSENVLITIQGKIKWADVTSEMDKKHRKEVEEKVEEANKSSSLKVKSGTLFDNVLIGDDPEYAKKLAETWAKHKNAALIRPNDEMTNLKHARESTIALPSNFIILDD